MLPPHIKHGPPPARNFVFYSRQIYLSFVFYRRQSTLVSQAQPHMQARLSVCNYDTQVTMLT